MANVSSSQRLHDPDPQTLDHLAHMWYPDCNPFAFPSTSFIRSPMSLVDDVGPGSCDSDWFSDTDSNSDRDVSCFVTDLFDRRSSEQPSNCCSDGDWGTGGFEDGDEIGLVFGFDSDRQVSVLEIGEHSGLHGVEDSRSDGLRIVGFDSESESDDGDVEVLGIDSGNSNGNRNSDYSVSDWNSHVRWDSICLEDQRSLYEDFEWEEVEEGRNNERENPRTAFDGDEVEELSVASGFSTIVGEPLEEEEALRNHEWQILLAINNLALNASLERGSDADTAADYSYFAVQDDMYTVEFDTFFGQFIESENALKGSPPAAKNVVENLPLVKLTMEELQKEDNVVVCAVCKEKILVDEEVKKLPCCHYYHGDCIVPWLSIRNTCPVCRYELPTDDPVYERRKSERAASAGMSRVTSNFEFFI
ncbi:hypothetical protein FNV43_RR13662 [Rhamnella rubrinervis]|uniref:RING-type E3 ubiquitin transferase n=1 Tax=Rhamnella rubrinervis TaxID=2594499 RepID=A0A8K0H1F3_9ROSA|nr:hypothetical protein FNV43_RR13662 [Rhamnella rubrinervis]